MSTHAVVGVQDREGNIHAAYFHADGYPNSVGPQLWKMAHKKGGALTQYIQKHPFGAQAFGGRPYRSGEQVKWQFRMNCFASWTYLITQRVLKIERCADWDHVVFIFSLDGPEPEWSAL